MNDELEGNLDLFDDKPAPAPKPAAKKALKEKVAPVGMPETTRIILEESDEIPPGGLGLGHNGRTYLLRPGEEVDVPNFLLEILDHAVMDKPVLQPGTKRVIGYRPQLRYNYRVVR